MMSKEDFLKIVEKRYDEIAGLNGLDDFYTYEDKFSDIWRETGRLILEKNLSDVPSDYRKKKG